MNNQFFKCCKCGKYNPDYLTFGYGAGHSVCLNHIPWYIRLKMRIKEAVRDED